MRPAEIFCRRAKKQGFALAAFCLPALCLFLAYSLAGHFPFGDKTVLTLDLSAQYVWFLSGLRSALFGDGSLFYSLSRSLGGEFLGIFAYYLSGPFSLLTLFFPLEKIHIAVYLILLLKTGFAGYAMFFCLRARYKTLSPLFALAFSMSYALCGFAVSYQHNLMWTDALCLLPILIRGLTELIEKGTWKRYTLTLTLLIFCNYYMGYMAGLFSALWFFFHLAAHKAEHACNYKRYFLEKTTKFIILSVFALIFTAVVWLPGLYGLRFGKLDFGTTSYLPSLQFSLFSLSVKLLPATYDSLIDRGAPTLYLGLCALLFLPWYFYSGHYPRREKVFRGAGLILLAFSMQFNITDHIWHATKAPNGLYYRCAFLLVFLLLYTVAAGVAHPPKQKYKAVYLLWGALCVLAVLAYFYAPEVVSPPVFLTVTLLSLVFFAILFFFFARTRRKGRTWLAAGLCVLLATELTANAVCTLHAIQNETGFACVAEFESHTESLLQKSQALREHDPSLYRTETTAHLYSNDLMGTGLFGVSGSTSTLHGPSLSFLKGIGYPVAAHRSRYESFHPFADALMGIRYCISDYAPQDYIPLENGIYQNPAALSLCYGIQGVPTLSFGVNAAENCNELAKALTGKDLGTVYVPMQNETRLHIGGTLYEAEENSFVLLRQSKDEPAALVFSATADEGGDFYFLLPAVTDAPAILSCNGRDLDVFRRATGYLIYLGGFQAGETVRVQLTLTTDTDALTFYQGEPHIYRYSEAAGKAYLNELSAASVSFDRLKSESSFGGSVTIASPDTVFLLTLPYDPCLRVRVDGKKAETFPVFEDGLTAFTITESGAHTVEIDYVPTAFFIGGGITLLGVTVFWAFLFLQKKKASS